MKKTIILPFIALALASCGKSLPTLTFQAETNRHLATIAFVASDTSTLFVTDYFPTLTEWDSVVRHSNGARLGWLSVYKGGEPIDILTIINSTPTFYAATTDADDGKIKVECTVVPDAVVAMWQNVVLPDQFVEADGNRLSITIPNEATAVERSFVRMVAADSSGVSNDILVPLAWGKPIKSTDRLTRHDNQGQVIYSLMIDRFENGNPKNDRSLNSKDVLPAADYMGGDVAGITKKIEDGFFDSIGVNTIWVSPVTQNPYDAWGQNERPRTKFSGYHGYWPIYITALDPRFADQNEFKQMIATAHEHNINVILDYVANHMHIDSPTLREHPDWVTPAKTADGRDNIALWDEYRLTTWFDKHIPTLDLERAEVYEPMTDSAMYWLETYDLDGFRHDASKHIPEVYWRTLTRKMRERLPERNIYQIGETYGSPALIGSYVRSGMMDAQFDFNLYDAMAWALADTSGSMENVMKTLKESLATYGYHNTMGYITGNHDRARFISYAGGGLSLREDAKQAGWDRDVTVGDSSVAYARLKLLETLIMTIPGVPTIYQGDDYGVPGGNDPDNRRTMQFSGYSLAQQSVRDNLSHLTLLRRSSMPLLYGDFVPLYADREALAFSRTYMGKTIVVAINNSKKPKYIKVELPFNDNQTLMMEVKPFSYEITKI